MDFEPARKQHEVKVRIFFVGIYTVTYEERKEEKRQVEGRLCGEPDGPKTRDLSCEPEPRQRCIVCAVSQTREKGDTVCAERRMRGNPVARAATEPGERT
jgi:hypothetical protein